MFSNIAVTSFFHSFTSLFGAKPLAPKTDVKEYALQQAISGKEWTGWKLVEGRSNRKYTSEAAVATTVEGAGFDPYERKILGVTAMHKLLVKTRIEELLAP